VKPNLLLVAVVLVTVLAGFTPGITWAFIAGLTANLLVGDPLGSIPLAMLVVAAIVGGGARLFGRAVWVYPIIAAFVGSLVADGLGLLIGQLVLDTGAARIPAELLLAAATLNAALTAVLLFPARAIARRSALEESPAW
jgi:rod shape-determining protein MreD